jgi:hypothetical protein
MNDSQKKKIESETLGSTPISRLDQAHPTPVKVSVMTPRPAVTKPASSPAVDSSISIDGDCDQNIGAIIIDAIAAAIAIAFTVLLTQDVIPFL